MFPREFQKLEKIVPEELVKAFDPSKNLKSLKDVSNLALPLQFRMNRKGGWITNDGNWFIPIITSQETAINRYLRNNDGRNFLIRAFEAGHAFQGYEQPGFGRFLTNPQQLKTLYFTFDPKFIKDRDVYTKMRTIAKFYNAIIPQKNSSLRFELKFPVYKDNKVFGYNIKRFSRLPFLLMEIDNLRNRV